LGKQINDKGRLPQNMLKAGEIRDLKPKEKPYKIGAGGSLFLLIMPSGAKYWRLKYFMNQKQKTLALGVYPEITLERAKIERDRAKELIKQGLDPVDVKHEEQNQRAKEANKPKKYKNEFRLAFSDDGKFTVETKTKVIHLSEKEAEAVYSFLGNTLKKRGSYA
jgi:hypothetical protein